MKANTKPQNNIRRFDVFTECERIKYTKRGFPLYVAKGLAIWTAKLVSGGKLKKNFFSGPNTGYHKANLNSSSNNNKSVFRSLNNVPQTDLMFDKEIIERMGKEFYEQTFQPMVRDNLSQGFEYRQFRDTLRNGLNSLN